MHGAPARLSTSTPERSSLYFPRNVDLGSLGLAWAGSYGLCWHENRLQGHTHLFGFKVSIFTFLLEIRTFSCVMLLVFGMHRNRSSALYRFLFYLQLFHATLQAGLKLQGKQRYEIYGKTGPRFPLCI